MKLTAPGRSWAEVNLDNIAHNYHEFCRVSATRVMCIIKADGYGHGAVMLAKRLQKEGCDAFGVATVDEGIELRKAGITRFILLLNQVSPDRIECALDNKLTMTVYSCEMARMISEKAGMINEKASLINEMAGMINEKASLISEKAGMINEKAKKKTKIHLKFDTGMTRVGFNPHEATAALKYIAALPNLEIEGVYTHFSSADETDTAYTNAQITKLKQVFAAADAAGIDIKIKHAANSAAAIMYPEARLNMVRVGISLYGCYPSEEVDKSRIDLKPAMQLKTQIFRINQVEAGTAVSYGRLFTTNRKTTLATLPIGYADGLSRVMAGKLKVLINGQLAPVVGKICMDQCVADITDITGEVSVFDEAVIYGTQKDAFQPVERIAKYMGTINYEILCMTARRIPRYYFENGKITDTENFLLQREYKE